MSKTNTMFKKIKSVISIYDILICIILGFIYSIYPEYYTKYSCDLNLKIIIKTFLLFLIFITLNVLFNLGINRIINNKSKNVISNIFNKNTKLYKYRLFIFGGIIFICWLPIILCLYPGTASNDAWGQLTQYIGLFSKGTLSDHHPIFDTLYMGGIIISLVKIFNNWHIAFFIYILVQSLITSLVFSYSLLYAKEKLKLNDVLITIFLIIYCILPIFPSSVQAISKDAIFAWIYVLFIINFIEIIRSDGKSLEGKKNFVEIIILSILCCLTKKVGMYVLLLSYFSILFIKIVNKKKIVYIISIILIFMLGFMPMMFKVFNIQKGGEQEKYSLFFQQTASYLKYNKNDVKPSEKKIIEKVIGKDIDTIISVYNPVFADPVKGYSQTTKKSNYNKYIIVWAKQGLRHPKSYYDATNSMLSGWVSFRMYKPLMNMDHHNQINPDIIPEAASQRNSSKKTAAFIEKLYDKIYMISIIKYILTPGLYISLIPLFSLSIFLKSKNKKNNMFVLVPLFLSIFLGCFLSPASDNIEGQRYMYPITYTIVITLMWVIFHIKEMMKQER